MEEAVQERYEAAMRARQSSIDANRQRQRPGSRTGHPLKLMSFEQRAELRKRYVRNIPRWRQPVVGYVLCIPLVVRALMTTLSVEHMLHHFYVFGSIEFLAVLFLAIFWGVGPAFSAVLVSTLLLDYFFIATPGKFWVQSWEDAIQLLPFIVAGITIAIITAQRERARLNALAAEHVLESYAQELEVSNQKLDDANQMKDRFLSIASHELKTPITTIRGQAQLILRRLSKQKELSPELESIRSTLARINEQTTRLTLLIDELLDVSSIRTGKMELRKRRCDLRELCSEVVNDQQLLTGRTITLDLPSTPVETHVDSDRLAQVMVNLIGNAVKYSPEGSPVEVHVCQNGEHALISVRDHGSGIDKDQQEHIFESFYRTPDAEASSKRGLGLGLAISKDIVERHRGRIWCESEPGQGSTFFVELPLR
jgi:signal transduction histidine kinase